MDTAGNSRNPTRDRLLVLLAFRLALRVSELVDIRRQQIDLDTATIHIRRAKNGTPGIHGLQGDELRLLRALRREHPHADFVFLSERKAPLSVDGAHEAVPQCGSFEVRFADGRPNQYFYWDDIPARRMRPETLDRETALEKAKAAARAAQSRLRSG